MKGRHNKKRNTAFVYEALIREATAAALKKDTERCNLIASLLQKHFNSESVLRRDLECHRALYETQGFPKETSEKILKEAKLANRLLDPDSVFKAQSELIKDINIQLEPSVFNAFVPNYKTLASISQLFSFKASPKDQVLLENEILKTMSADPAVDTELPAIDNVVIRAFVQKFNTKYEDELLQEQKDLLSRYISSFADNALELKIFLNEEIARLKEKLEKAKDTQDIKNDNDMMKKTQEVIGCLEGFSTQAPDEKVLLTVLKTQSLVKEIYTDGSNS